VVGGSRNDGDVSFFVDSVPSHAGRRRRQLMGTAASGADPLRRAKVKVGWARLYGPGPKGVGSEEQHYNAAQHRAGQ
jgi:hypothetical protein